MDLQAPPEPPESMRLSDQLSWLPTRRSAFAGAKASQQVRQRIVAFVAGVFIDRAGRARHGQFAFPWPSKSSGVVDLELIENRIRVEQAEAFHNVQISVPAKHTTGVPIKAAAIFEVSGIHHE